MQYFVYILYNRENGRFYVGKTANLRRRLNQHKNAKLSHRNIRFICIFVEIFINQEDADKREKYFKSSKGKYTLRAMLKNTLQDFQSHKT